MMRRWLTFLLLATPLAGASGSAIAQVQTGRPDVASGTGVVDKTTQADDVKFRDDADKRMTVPVRVGGKGPFRFLVDTGADRTAVSRQLASRLGLASGSMASLHSIAGVSSVSTAMVPDLQLSRHWVSVVDAPLLDGDNIGADGILGVDSLRSQRVEFDFEKNFMSIVPSAKRDSIDEPDAIVIIATNRRGRLILTEAKVNGRPVTVVLDTGSQVSIGNRALQTMLTSQRKRPQSTRPVELISVTGDKLSGDYMLVRNLAFGEIMLRDLAVVFANAHTFGQLNLVETPALLLGMNAIRAFKKVSIDFARRKFRIVLPERSMLDSATVAAARGGGSHRISTF